MISVNSCGKFHLQRELHLSSLSYSVFLVVSEKKDYTYQVSRESVICEYSQVGVPADLTVNAGLHLSRLHLARADCSKERIWILLTLRN